MTVTIPSASTPVAQTRPEPTPAAGRKHARIAVLGASGYSGQEFIPSVLPKIAELRRALDDINSPAWLEVDGGISLATLPGVREAGADVFVSGSFIFQHPQGIAEGIRSLRKSALL